MKIKVLRVAIFLLMEMLCIFLIIEGLRRNEYFLSITNVLNSLVWILVYINIKYQNEH